MDVDAKSCYEDIDEDLYSRQLLMLGSEGMKRMQTSNVLICGLRAMGVEIAKNVILSGAKAVALYDPSPVLPQESGCNFCLTEAKAGLGRAGAVLDQLSELNSYVRVSCLCEKLTEDVLRRFQVVVLCDAPFSEQLLVGDMCHREKIKFISMGSYGLFGSLFCDFGEQFLVVDKDGKEPRSILIWNISQETEGLVGCDVEHNLETGDWVTFSGVNGMCNLNSCKPQRIKVISPLSFSIGDTSHFPEYSGGGVATECKMPFTLQFKSLRDSLKEPEFVPTDHEKLERPPQLLAAFEALDLFVSEKGQLPRPYNKEDAELLFKLTEGVNSRGMKADLDKNLIEKVAFVCRGELMPIISFLGGIAAHEVVKACTGKLSPLKQFLFFDALECLPPDDQLPSHQPDFQEDRYSGQRLVFGEAFQQKLANLNYFVIGAGAHGCELLKNFSMMGVGTGANGKVIVTDMDVIERCDLNQNLLFHPWDIGKNKSAVAALAAQKMNPALNIEPHLNKVGCETEPIYCNKFFSTLCGVALALNDSGAKHYIQSRCVYCYLPLLGCYTIGSRARAQVALPFLTECDFNVQSQCSVDMNMLKAFEFPGRFEQLVYWAQIQFEAFFFKPSRMFDEFKSDESYLECEKNWSKYRELLDLKRVLSEIPASFPDCVAWARLQFEDLFTSRIKKLLHNFPPDHTTSQGLPFWSGNKRCPAPICYDSSNELHMDFIEMASLLYAESRCIRCEGVTREQIRSLAAQVTTPVFNPNECGNCNYRDLHQDELDSLKQEIQSMQLPDSFCMRALDLNLNDNSNRHLDFITCCSNLRASNFQIGRVHKYQSKQFICNTTPYIVTTISAVVGLMCLELYKLTRDQECSRVEINLRNYREAFFDIAKPSFSFHEPPPVTKQKFSNIEFSLWDRIEIDGLKSGGGEITTEEFIALFREEYHLEVTMILCHIKIVFFIAGTQKNTLKMQLSKAVEHVEKKPIPPSQTSLLLILCCEDKNGDDVEVPTVEYNFRCEIKLTNVPVSQLSLCV